MKKIFINGKFYSGGLNGVHRVADRLIRELDEQILLIDPRYRPEVFLLIPLRRQWTPSLKAVKVVEQRNGHTQWWEQCVLPWIARGGVILNLCNLAPIIYPNKVLLLHDAQFLFPNSSYPWRTLWGHRILTPLMARTSRSVITVSEYSAQMLSVFRIASADRLRVIYNGADHILDADIDNDVIARNALAGSRYVVHIASPKAYKNSAVVFDAFSSKLLLGVNLINVGPTQEELTKAGLEPPAGSICVGKISDGELRALYLGAICLVFPSRTEGFGLPPVEAMAVGCPVVSSPGGAMPEICRDAVLYAGVNEPEEWIAAVLALRDGPDFRLRKIAQGLSRASSFRWSVSGQRLARLLDFSVQDDISIV